MQLNVKKQLQTFQLEIDLALADSGTTVIFGRSGCGKTSLVQLISGLSKPDSGKIVFKEQVFYDSQTNTHLSVQARQLAYVFQNPRLFPHYSVAGNLCYAMPDKKPRTLKRKDQLIELLDLSALLKRKPKDLSGGEKQRVAIGRALMRNPQLVLLDEPLASLDFPKKQSVLPYLQVLAKQFEIPIYYVTHSIEEMLQLADRVLFLEDGKATLYDSVEVLWSSNQFKPWLKNRSHSTLLTTTLLRQHPTLGLSELQISNTSTQTLWVATVNQAIGSQVRVRLYANDISLSSVKPMTSTDNVLTATVIKITSNKPAKADVNALLTESVELAVDNLKLTANISLRALQRLNLAPGQTVYAAVKSVLLYNTAPASTFADKTTGLAQPEHQHK